jgi:cytochrome c
MDSFELNKMIGAFLAVVFVVFSVSLVSDSIFATHSPETPGYAIEVPEEVSAVTADAADAGPSVIELLASADPSAGESVFRRCASCHTVEEGGANRVGPNLWDIVNRPVASKEGFSYSAGMRAYAEGGTQWEYENLIAFLHDPRGYVSGTTMAFAGIRNPQEEANLIAYLRTLSDDPAPLPEVAAAPEDEAADTEAEPVQPTPEDDGTSAGPEVDAGTPAEGEMAPDTGVTAPGTEEAPAEDAAPATEEAPADEAVSPDASADDAEDVQPQQ